MRNTCDPPVSVLLSPMETLEAIVTISIISAAVWLLVSIARKPRGKPTSGGFG